MEWFDCNTYFGLPTKRPLRPVETVGELLRAMDRAGIGRALVWHIAQHDYSATGGNQILAREIAAHERLIGCCAVLPRHTGEMPGPPRLFDQMRQARFAAVRLFPQRHAYVLNPVTMAGLFESLEARRVPILLSVTHGVDWPELYRLLEGFPSLTCIICDHGSWGRDRLFRPLLDTYPNVYVDTAQFLLDGGIEDLVAAYGARRLVFGSGFPDHYHGGMMLALQHATISDEDRAAVAGGNLARILAEAEL